jgi:hypothetical protein
MINGNFLLISDVMTISAIQIGCGKFQIIRWHVLVLTLKGDIAILNPNYI